MSIIKTSSFRNSLQTIREAFRDFDLSETEPEKIMQFIESQTDMPELCAAIVIDIQEDDAMIGGLKSHIDDLTTRKVRMEMTRDTKRQMLGYVIDVIGCSMQLPFATISKSKGGKVLAVSDESQIPANYWKIPEPKPSLDKKALLDDLKDGVVVDGVELAQSPDKLMIRVK